MGTGGSTDGTGGSDGTGGTGGNSGNGGSGQPSRSKDSELVSGSRLKALYLGASDGARAPAASSTFWDSQLMTFCSASASAGACIPVRAAVMVDSNYGSYFADDQCMTSPLGIAALGWDMSTNLYPGLSQQDPPAQFAYGFDTNNDKALIVRPILGAFTGTAYRTDFIYGNCTAGGVQGGVLVSLGEPMPASTFVSFSYAIDQ